MADYPYPANFLEPMPAWPVNLACQKIVPPFFSLLFSPSSLSLPLRSFTYFIKLTQQGTILERLFDSISVYYNYTGEVSCFNTSVYMTSAASNVAWDYQVRVKERKQERKSEGEELEASRKERNKLIVDI